MNTTDSNVKLCTPIVRRDQRINQVKIKRILAADLHGLRLIDLVNSDVDALSEILPRVTSPHITKDEVLGLDVADLVQMANEICAQATKYMTLMQSDTIDGGSLQ